jgi:glycosyltransferase involved in cell wall biosynthesis
VRLNIVGKDPPAEIRELADQQRVFVTGTVDDIRPYLQKATLAVAPLTYGAGIQNKVLEAMACATPVICTPQAGSALMAVPGKEIIIAETNEEMAQTIIELLDNPKLLEQIGRSGRDYVERHHQWGDITSSLLQIYDHAISFHKNIQYEAPQHTRIHQ